LAVTAQVWKITREVPLARLKVDRAGGLQRDLDEAYYLRTIVGKFKPHKLGVLTVSEREDGDNVVLDGQGRLFSLRYILGDPALREQIEREIGERVPESIECEVFHGLSHEEEGDMFIGRNTRRPVHIIFMFYNRLRAKEPVAVEVDQVLRYHGTCVDFHARRGFGCVGLLDKLQQNGTLVSTIRIVEETWPGEEIYRRRRQMVEGVSLFHQQGMATEGYSVSEAIRRFQLRQPKVNALYELAHKRALATGVNQAVTVARLLRETYNIGAKRRMGEIYKVRGA